MKFELDEILTIIDKVKSTELASFEYRDADTKIKIRGTKTANSGRAEAQAAAVQNPAVNPQPSAQNHTAKQQDAAQNQTVVQQAAAAGQGEPVMMQNTAAGQSDAMQTQPQAAAENTAVIESPMVGTFYAAPAEGEAPFVQVGDTVTKGQTVGIVEAMKLMNEIEAECSGVVEAVLVENEQLVEYGQPLFRIRQ